MLVFDGVLWTTCEALYCCQCQNLIAFCSNRATKFAMPKFHLMENDKFAILAVEKAYADLPEDCEAHSRTEPGCFVAFRWMSKNSGRHGSVRSAWTGYKRQASCWS